MVVLKHLALKDRCVWTILHHCLVLNVLVPLDIWLLTPNVLVCVVYLYRLKDGCIKISIIFTTHNNSIQYTCVLFVSHKNNMIKQGKSLYVCCVLINNSVLHLVNLPFTYTQISMSATLRITAALNYKCAKIQLVASPVLVWLVIVHHLHYSVKVNTYWLLV